MKLTSTAFEHNGRIPKIYTIDGKAINPPLAFRNVPMGTVSLALIVEDPDVPPQIREDRMFDHWVVWNMPADANGIEENSKPPGVEGLNTAGDNEYRRPAPPDAEHRYVFKLFALDTMLDLSASLGKQDLLEAMKGHIIDDCELIGLYQPGGYAS